MVRGASEVIFIAECFWPDVRDPEVELAAERIRQSAAELTRAGATVELTGTIFVPGDEVVFFLFDGSAASVREVCRRAQVPFDRVVESVRRAERAATEGAP